MKKFILTITFILMFFTTSFVSAYAEPSLEDAKNIYIDIINNYKYNKELGESAFNSCPDKNIAGMFYHDVTFAYNNKGGACRQLSSVLIYNFLKSNIGASQLILGYNDIEKSHTCVIYKLNGQTYVADPALQLQLKSENIQVKINLVNLTLSNYINFLKSLNCKYETAIVLNCPPPYLNKDINELKDNIDCMVYHLK